MADDGEDTANEFANLIAEMKKYLQTNEIERALHYAEKAYEHKPSDKLSAKIEKMKKYLEEEDSEEADDLVLVGNGFYVDPSIYKRLYPYQLEGILWMWSLYNKKTGGILGDDMGLGKTVQVISFLGGMFDMELVHTVLIVMPLSLITNWKKEFEEWAPGLNVFEFHGTKRERERNLRRIRHKGGVILTTYGLIVTSVETLSTNERGQKFTWDYLILDEGHKIKNRSKTTTAANELPAKCRLVLTGTPVQNNLQEMWSLFNFTHCGTLLGSLRTFHMGYENAIIHGCAKDASAAERQFGKHASESLRNLIAPYFLRRTKQQIMKESLQPQLNAENQVLSVPNLTIPKNELVVWLYLSPAQVKIYREFLQLDKIKEILMTKRSPLVELTVLKKICDHPRLMSVRCCAMLGLDGKENIPEDEIDLDTELQKVDIDHVTDEQLIQESGKLVFVLKLLEDLKRTGHRCLIFSQSRKMLDIIQRILKNRDFKCIRLDGTISKLQDRQTIIDNFQNKSKYDVFLLTTQVGGVGLTLTGADRVIIYDPSWNPATDAQAVDRVYRIGQSKPVVVYRLITCATVEEKIYRRQIFKDGINRQTTGDNKGDTFRYFTKEQLRDLFTLVNPKVSETQGQLEEMHGGDKKTYLELDDHLSFLSSLNIFGISHHDLMFSKGDEGLEEDDLYQHQYKRQVEEVQAKIRMETEMLQQKNSNKDHLQWTDRNTYNLISGETPMKSYGKRPQPPVKNLNSSFQMLNIDEPITVDDDTNSVRSMSEGSPPPSPCSITEDVSVVVAGSKISSSRPSPIAIDSPRMDLTKMYDDHVDNVIEETSPFQSNSRENPIMIDMDKMVSDQRDEDVILVSDSEEENENSRKRSPSDTNSSFPINLSDMDEDSHLVIGESPVSQISKRSRISESPKNVITSDLAERASPVVSKNVREEIVNVNTSENHEESAEAESINPVDEDGLAANTAEAHTEVDTSTLSGGVDDSTAEDGAAVNTENREEAEGITENHEGAEGTIPNVVLDLDLGSAHVQPEWLTDFCSDSPPPLNKPLAGRKSVCRRSAQLLKDIVNDAEDRIDEETENSDYGFGKGLVTDSDTASESSNTEESVYSPSVTPVKSEVLRQRNSSYEPSEVAKSKRVPIISPDINSKSPFDVSNPDNSVLKDSENIRNLSIVSPSASENSLNESLLKSARRNRVRRILSDSEED